MSIRSRTPSPLYRFPHLDRVRYPLAHGLLVEPETGMSTTLLIAVVADALEERAAAIAREEGAMGVTILSARGIGFPEHVTFFGLTYRGLEKVMLWVLDHATSQTIADRLNRELDLLSPFQGLAFCLEIDHAEGIDSEAIRRHVTNHVSSRTPGKDDGI